MSTHNSVLDCMKMDFTEIDAKLVWHLVLEMPMALCSAYLS
jgi:hypothetical protein